MEKNWEKRIKKIISWRNMAVFLTFAYAVSLIPILWIARYNYPSADDLTNGSNCYHIWEESHSLFRVLGEAASRAVNEWFVWRGCFTSSFLSALTPNAFGVNWYFLTTWMVLGILSIGMICLFRMIFGRIFGADKHMSHSIAMLTLLVTVQCMGAQERVEAFFWYSGAVNYVFIHGVSLIFMGVLIALAVNKEKKQLGLQIVASVLGFLVGGGNQMTILNMAIVLFVTVALLVFQKKWDCCKRIGFPVALFYVGFVLSIVAPGNFVRAESAIGMNPVKAVMVSFYYCLDLALSEWTAWPLLVVVLAMIPIFWHMASQTDFSFPYPMITVLFGYCLVSAMFTPPLYVMGNVEAGRLKALAYIMYVMILVLCVGYVVGWMRKRYECSMELTGSDRQGGSLAECSANGAGSWLYILGCMAFFVFGSLLTIIPEPHYYTFSSAITDLANGSARAYGRAQEARVAMYLSKPEGIVEVEELEAQPGLLFFSDITEDEQDWTNQGVARFYDLDGVVLRKGDFG